MMTAGQTNIMKSTIEDFKELLDENDPNVTYTMVGIKNDTNVVLKYELTIPMLWGHVYPGLVKHKMNELRDTRFDGFIELE